MAYKTNADISSNSTLEPQAGSEVAESTLATVNSVEKEPQQTVDERTRLDEEFEECLKSSIFTPEGRRAFDDNSQAFINQVIQFKNKPAKYNENSQPSHEVLLNVEPSPEKHKGITPTAEELTKETSLENCVLADSKSGVIEPSQEAPPSVDSNTTPKDGNPNKKEVPSLYEIREEFLDILERYPKTEIEWNKDIEVAKQELVDANRLSIDTGKELTPEKVKAINEAIERLEKGYKPYNTKRIEAVTTLVEKYKNLPEEAKECKALVRKLIELVKTGDKGFEVEGIEEGACKYFSHFKSVAKALNADGYIAVLKSDCLYDYKKNVICTDKMTRNILARYKVLNINTDKKGVESFTFVSVATTFFGDINLSSFELQWVPSRSAFCTFKEKEFGRDIFNLWRGFAYEPKNHNIKGLTDAIKYHIKHYLCSDDEKSFRYFWAILVDMFLNPGRRLPVVTVLIGEGGQGKNIIFDLFIAPLLGSMYSEHTGSIPTTFDYVFEKKLCFILNETDQSQKQLETDLLKAISTSSTKEINRKNEHPYIQDNCTRYYVTSNFISAIKIVMDGSDRRYLVVNLSDDKPNAEYFKVLAKFLKGSSKKGEVDLKYREQAFEQFLFDIKDEDVSILEEKPPETAMKIAMQNRSKSPLEKNLEEFLVACLENSMGGVYTSTSQRDPMNNCYKERQILGGKIKTLDFLEFYNIFCKDNGYSLTHGREAIEDTILKIFGKSIRQRSSTSINGKKINCYVFDFTNTDFIAKKLKERGVSYLASEEDTPQENTVETPVNKTPVVLSEEQLGELEKILDKEQLASIRSHLGANSGNNNACIPTTETKTEQRSADNV